MEALRNRRNHEPSTEEGFCVSFNRYPYVYHTRCLARRPKLTLSPRSRARRTFRMALATADGMEEMHDDDSDGEEMKPKICKTVWSPEVRPRSRDPGPNNSSNPSRSQHRPDVFVRGSARFRASRRAIARRTSALDASGSGSSMLPADAGRAVDRGPRASAYPDHRSHTPRPPLQCDDARHASVFSRPSSRPEPRAGGRSAEHAGDDPRRTQLVVHRRGGPNHSSKSCRLRWCNQLDPALRRDNFSEAEDRTIMAAYKKLGNRWASIAKLSPAAPTTRSRTTSTPSSEPRRGQIRGRPRRQGDRRVSQVQRGARGPAVRTTSSSNWRGTRTPARDAIPSPRDPRARTSSPRTSAPAASRRRWRRAGARS